MEAKSCFAESFWGTCFGPHREEGGGVGSFSYLFEGTYAFFLKKYFYCKKKKNLKSTQLVMNCFEIGIKIQL